MSYEDAHKIIEEVYPKPKSNPEYINPPIDKNIDLSIIIPAYNYVNVIAENIQSAIDQKTKYNYDFKFLTKRPSW